MEYKKITIFTQVYNTESCLRQCLESVVNQKYPIHQYLIVDNGCTDGSSEIIKEYAAKYDYINVIRYEQNQRNFWYNVISEKATGDYVTVIDSDDWWELDYLEKMISFLELDNIDLVLTGSLKYIDKTGKRQLHTPRYELPAILTQKQFAESFEKYHIFAAAIWGNIMRVDVFKKVDFDSVLKKVPIIPQDTAFMLEYVRKCAKIGVRNDELYNYRVREHSVTYEYQEKRFYSNLGYYDIVIEFLESNSAYNKHYKEWCKFHIMYYINATLETIIKSNISVEEKTAACLKICKHKVTQEAVANKSIFTKLFIKNINGFINESIGRFNDIKYSKMAEICLNLVLSNCGEMPEHEFITLCNQSTELWDLFINEDLNASLIYILHLMKSSGFYNYDFKKLVSDFLPEESSLSQIKESKFFELYSEICVDVLSQKNKQALEKMNEILFSGKELDCPEDFLNLYVTLAAIENNIEAFLFGKIQKAYFFIDENRKSEAKQIVNELVEIGVGDNEAVLEIVNNLKFDE